MQGKVCGLSAYDINLATKLITLNHGLDKKNRLTDLKNTGAQRTLRIPNSLIQPIKTQMDYNNTVRSKSEKYPYLFVLQNGASINPDTYCQHFQRLIRKINKTSSDIYLKQLTPYGLRHTFATLSLFKGVHIKAVAKAGIPRWWVQAFFNKLLIVEYCRYEFFTAMPP